jgi:hypothetical protein
MDKTRYSCENIYFEFLGKTQREDDDDIRRKRISELLKKTKYSFNENLRCEKSTR